MTPTQIAAEAAREVANKCALHLPYIKEREIGKATAIIQSAIEKATEFYRKKYEQASVLLGEAVTAAQESESELEKHFIEKGWTPPH